ncbi:MAG: hypothetical protein AAF960_30145, partial [Bacteroidota bacterium]
IGDEITQLSNELEVFFEKNGNYSSNIKEVHIGLICVNKNFEEFFHPRGITYSETEQILETEAKLDFSICSLESKERIAKIKSTVCEALLTLTSYFDVNYEINVKEALV